ncbi:unnamed protein product [Auanema sp. JU1783]|nr:unnamed protein product [Auanema sp. JU1783]
MDTTTVAIATAVIVVLITLLLLFKKGVKKNTVLFVGLSDSGKTKMFTKIVNRNADAITYTSFQENIVELQVKGDSVHVVDFPGGERFRKQLAEKWLTKERSSLKGIVFVIDASTYSKRARDVAEFLYDVILNSGSRIPVLSACNKQDLNLAKSDQVVKTALEKELGLINKTRAAALVTTDGSANRKTLTDTGSDFTWSDLKCSVDFVECSAESDKGLDAIRSWLKN